MISGIPILFSPFVASDVSVSMLFITRDLCLTVSAVFAMWGVEDGSFRRGCNIFEVTHELKQHQETCSIIPIRLSFIEEWCCVFDCGR